MDDRVKTLFPLPPQISPILCLYVLHVWCEAGSSRSTMLRFLPGGLFFVALALVRASYISHGFSYAGVATKRVFLQDL